MIASPPDASPVATLAHEREWLQVIDQAYGHTPIALTSADDEGRVGVLPAVVVHRPFLGPIVASMPFLDSGGPVGASVAVRRALVDRLLAEARERGARAVEIRCTDRLDVPGHTREDKVNLVLRLNGDPDALWHGFDGRVRNQVRKAERSGLSVERQGAEGLDAFYPIFAARMHDLGSPVHARAFFAAVLAAFQARASVFVVRKDRTPIGALIAIRYGATVAVPWAACLQDHFHLCPNMLLYWQAIRTSAEAGAERFEFGRSTRGSGTYRFKRQWGADEQALFWHTVPVGRSSVRPAPASHHRSLLAGSWRRLPRTVTTRVGPVLRRYLTQ
jgi:FemAB-related protein (PEP-CTERM system-associated)